MPYRKIETTYEVYATLLRNFDGRLGVYESFSNPDGYAFGGGGREGEMFTKWGFKHATIPLMEAQTNFELEYYTVMGEFVSRRINERHQYWLWLYEEDAEE